MGASTELGHGQICTTRKKGKEISSGRGVGGESREELVLWAGEIIHTMQPEQFSWDMGRTV